MATTPEGKTKLAIRRWLDAHGIWYFMPVPSGRGVNGVPDFICCAAGKFLAIEAKAAGRRGNTSALQDVQIDSIRKAGGAALVVDDVSQLNVLDGRLA